MRSYTVEMPERRWDLSLDGGSWNRSQVPTVPQAPSSGAAKPIASSDDWEDLIKIQRHLLGCPLLLGPGKGAHPGHWGQPGSFPVSKGSEEEVMTGGGGTLRAFSFQLGREAVMVMVEVTA